MTRWLGPILCVVGAAVMTLAVLGHRWGSVRPAEHGGRIGLLDAIRCDGPCETVGHGATEATRIEGEQFARLGQAGVRVRRPGRARRRDGRAIRARAGAWRAG